MFAGAETTLVFGSGVYGVSMFWFSKMNFGGVRPGKKSIFALLETFRTCFENLNGTCYHVFSDGNKKRFVNNS